MAAHAVKTWLVAYDIRDARRLQRVGRRARRHAAGLQYSVYGFEGNDKSIESFVAELERLIDSRVDDLRAYHVPERCRVWALGRQSLPDGVELAGVKVVEIFGSMAGNGLGADAAQVEGGDTLREPIRQVTDLAVDSGAGQSNRLPRLRGD